MSVSIEWHSTSDILPDVGKRVVVNSGPAVLIGKLIDDEGKTVFIDDSRIVIHAVKYWATLPKTPNA